jgi:Tol biopolymer transport system component
MTLWRVPIEGGQPVQISDSLSLQPAISPDGKLIAHYDLRHEADPQWGVTVIPFGGGAPLRRFSIPVSELSRLVRWSPDGRALTYIDGSEGNLWSQPLAGGPPVRLTDFKAERTFSFDWEPSGEQLVCARGLLTSDVVLIRDFR